jgi:hypothetical protein
MRNYKPPSDNEDKFRTSSSLFRPSSSSLNTDTSSFLQLYQQAGALHKSNLQMMNDNNEQVPLSRKNTPLENGSSNTHNTNANLYGTPTNADILREERQFVFPPTPKVQSPRQETALQLDNKPPNSSNALNFDRHDDINCDDQVHVVQNEAPKNTDNPQPLPTKKRKKNRKQKKY